MTEAEAVGTVYATVCAFAAGILVGIFLRADYRLPVLAFLAALVLVGAVILFSGVL